MKKLTLFSYLLFVCSLAFSQTEKLPQKTNHSFYFNIPLKYSYNNLAGINNSLKESGIKPLSQSFIETGIGFRYTFKRFGAGFDMLLAGGSLSNYNRSELRCNSTTNHFFLSYNLIYKNNFIVFPQVGYSSSSYLLTVSNNISSANFNQTLKGPGNATMVSNQNNFVSFSIGILSNAASKRSSARALTVGYNLALNNNQWALTSGTASSAPTDKMSNFYIQYSFGISMKK